MTGNYVGALEKEVELGCGPGSAVGAGASFSLLHWERSQLSLWGESDSERGRKKRTTLDWPRKTKHSHSFLCIPLNSISIDVTFNLNLFSEGADSSPAGATSKDDFISRLCLPEFCVAQRLKKRRRLQWNATPAPTGFGHRDWKAVSEWSEASQSSQVGRQVNLSGRERRRVRCTFRLPETADKRAWTFPLVEPFVFRRGHLTHMVSHLGKRQTGSHTSPNSRKNLANLRQPPVCCPCCHCNKLTVSLLLQVERDRGNKSVIRGQRSHGREKHWKNSKQKSNLLWPFKRSERYKIRLVLCVCTSWMNLLSIKQWPRARLPC